jgi:DNA-binding transcriptional regulator YbjK
MGRREDILDAAITLLGAQGVRALTHRAVDTAAGLPAGSTSNYFRTTDALFDAVAERFADRERQNWEEIALTMSPTTPAELAEAMAVFVHASVETERTLTLARYAVLVEAAVRPSLRPRLMATGARVNQYFTNWLRIAGVADPEAALPIVANYLVGLVLHQLAYPRPDFDPLPGLENLIRTLSAEGSGDRP